MGLKCNDIQISAKKPSEPQLDESDKNDQLWLSISAQDTQIYDVTDTVLKYPFQCMVKNAFFLYRWVYTALPWQLRK